MKLNEAEMLKSLVKSYWDKLDDVLEDYSLICAVLGLLKEHIAPGTTEARPGSHLSEMDGYDGWYSDYPMTNCTGVGTELKE